MTDGVDLGVISNTADAAQSKITDQSCQIFNSYIDILPDKYSIVVLVFSASAKVSSETTTNQQQVILPTNCLVILNGQKCQLRINPSTGALVACPVKGAYFILPFLL